MLFEFKNMTKTGYYLSDLPITGSPQTETLFVRAKGAIYLEDNQITAQVEGLVKQRRARLRKVEGKSIVESPVIVEEPQED